MVEPFSQDDLQSCVDLFIETYNCPPWYNQWTTTTARNYLTELVDSKRFVGFTLWNQGKLIGAAFCHEKTWWNSDELYIDEFFISTRFQRKGYGKTLLNSISEYAKQRHLASITLLTDNRKPAYNFYTKNGMLCINHLAFMYKDT